MSHGPSLDELVHHPPLGADELAAQAFKRFAHRLVALARSRLDTLARQKLDPEDVVQSVFRSFFARQAEGQFELVTWEGLWGILTRSTVWKCRDKLKHLHAERRDVRREVAASPGMDDRDSWQAVARDPSPVEAAMLAETVEQLMGRLDDRGRQILALSLQGCTPQEVSSQVGQSVRTVQRVLARVKKWLEEST